MLGDDHGRNPAKLVWRGSACNTLISESLRPRVSQENNR